MTIAIICSLKSDRLNVLQNAILKAIGIPVFQTLDGDKCIYFYRHNDDADELRYEISQYLVKVYRAKHGHKAFVDIHMYFNRDVEVQEDVGNHLFLQYAPTSLLDDLGVFR